MSGTRCVMLDTVHQCKILTEYLNHLYVTNPTIGLVSPSRLLAMNLLWYQRTWMDGTKSFTWGPTIT